MKNFDEEVLLRKTCPAKYNEELLSSEIELAVANYNCNGPSINNENYTSIPMTPLIHE